MSKHVKHPSLSERLKIIQKGLKRTQLKGKTGPKKLSPFGALRILIKPKVAK